MTAPAVSELVEISLDQLRAHPGNPNMMSPELKAKLAEHIRRTGRYPPLVVRPLGRDRFQVLDGHQRVDVLRHLGIRTATCLVWDVTDHDALVLVATLNRLRGEDNPGRRAALVRELAAEQTLAELARLLPEDQAELEEAINFPDLDVETLVAELTAQAEREASRGPQLFSFAIDPSDAPTVEAAIEAAASRTSGLNRRGQALVRMAEALLASGQRED